MKITAGMCVVATVALAVGAIGIGLVGGQPKIPSTRTDYYFHGTQPSDPNMGGIEFLRDAGECAACHGQYEESQAPYERWRFSMMAQSYRDPIFHAALQIAEKDASFSSDACLRCHAPMGWFQNRAQQSDGSDLQPTDTQGVSCQICHRSVDPAYVAGTSPIEDLDVLNMLGNDRPPSVGQGGAQASGHLVIDPEDRRRGPFDLGEFFFHRWLESPWHRSGDMCVSCHDISNPAFSKQPDGSYVLNDLNQKHPTGNKYDMYPLDRLGSEWKMSAFAQGPITQVVPDGNGGFVGRYGGFQTTSYSSCQDCHMPAVEGTGCAPFLGSPVRPNVPQHNFAGGNTWVLRAVGDLFNPADTYLDDPNNPGTLDTAGINAAIERNKQMLRAASDMTLTRVSDKLKVRIVNESGHKFPGGFSEGRRLWINVKFFGAGNQLIDEVGAYNSATAELDHASTKVYEAKQGIDTYMADYLAQRAVATGNPNLALPPGPTFNLDINNKMTFDNRIPPRGFTNANFAMVQAAPVGVTYADGQHWDDTYFEVPVGTTRIETRTFFQTTSKEYVEFLRDKANKPLAPTDYIQPPAGSNATTLGQIVYEQWVKWGKSTPVEVDTGTAVGGACLADFGGQGGVVGADGSLDNNDFAAYITVFFDGSVFADVGEQGGVQGSDGQLDNNDFVAFISAFFQGC